jgi:hypothetical protein
MPTAMETPKTYSIARRDPRVPIEVGVHLGGLGAQSARESTFTQDVSARGARVVSARRWKKNQRLTLTALAGGFHSVARVAYCKTFAGVGFSVGLELIEPTGNWIIGREETN